MDIEDIFNEILGYVACITDVRNLSRTCKLFHNYCTNKIKTLDKLYQQKYEHLFINHHLRCYSQEKFTFEAVIDCNYNALKEHYYNEKNNVMCPILSFSGNLELLKYAHSKQCPLVDAQHEAARNGHINILEWLAPHTDFKKLGELISMIAAKNG